jgi:hypothetical protein
MKLALTLLCVLSLCKCSTMIGKTGWRPKDGTPRRAILAKLGEPAESVKRNNLPQYAPVSQAIMVPLKDHRGREDTYVTRRVIAEHDIAWGAFCLDGARDTLLYLFGETLYSPVAAVQHWVPPRRELTIYYDRHDSVQGYTLDPIINKTPPPHR